MIFHEDGRIAFHYGAFDHPLQQGAGATIGIENASGTVAALYSFQEAALTSQQVDHLHARAAGHDQRHADHGGDRRRRSPAPPSR